MKQIRIFDSIEQSEQILSTLEYITLSAVKETRGLTNLKIGKAAIKPLDPTVPFYIENISDEQATVTIEYYKSNSMYYEYGTTTTIQTSLDGLQWSDDNYITNRSRTKTFVINAKERMYFRGKVATATSTSSGRDEDFGALSWTSNSSSLSFRHYIRCDKQFNIGGNIMSLVTLDKFTGSESTIPPDGNEYSNVGFASLFSGNKTLISAEKLLIPAITTHGEFMQSTFFGCDALQVGPTIKLKNLNYKNTLSYCFQNCSSLKRIVCLCESTNPNPEFSNSQWVKDVSTTGVFVKKRGVEWPTGINGIPEGWTIEEVD